MGCWDEEAEGWQIVCKVANGMTNARLEELKQLLVDDNDSLMVRPPT